MSNEANIDLKANAAGVKIGVGEARKEIEKFSEQSKAALRSLNTASKEMEEQFTALDESLAQTGETAEEASSSYLELAKTAVMLGASFTKIGQAVFAAELAYEGLKIGLENTGQSMTVLDKSLTKSQQLIDDAGGDVTKLTKTLADMGVTAEDVGIKVENNWTKSTDAIKKAGSELAGGSYMGKFVAELKRGALEGEGVLSDFGKYMKDWGEDLGRQAKEGVEDLAGGLGGLAKGARNLAARAMGADSEGLAEEEKGLKIQEETAAAAKVKAIHDAMFAEEIARQKEVNKIIEEGKAEIENRTQAVKEQGVIEVATAGQLAAMRDDVLTYMQKLDGIDGNSVKAAEKKLELLQKYADLTAAIAAKKEQEDAADRERTLRDSEAEIQAIEDWKDAQKAAMEWKAGNEQAKIADKERIETARANIYNETQLHLLALQGATEEQMHEARMGMITDEVEALKEKARFEISKAKEAMALKKEDNGQVADEAKRLKEIEDRKDKDAGINQPEAKKKQTNKERLADIKKAKDYKKEIVQRRKDNINSKKAGGIANKRAMAAYQKKMGEERRADADENSPASLHHKYQGSEAGYTGEDTDPTMKKLLEAAEQTNVNEERMIKALEGVGGLA